MPTNRTKRTRNRADLDAQHVDQLVTGLPLLAGTGFAAGIQNGCNSWSTADWRAFDLAAREGWRQHGAAILRWWRRESEQFTAYFHTDPRKAGEKPWALTEFGEPK
ncbi:MAG: hypothetical protein CFE32_16015 [Alphaproteobacteria bacterium PA3]|nr:MAG: hypothetical protein CFE32_16015 [Alphaproteobacteria bacterium PA3]